MRIRKSLSIQENILDIASKKAKKLGMNFSTYITYLIIKDNPDKKERS